MHLINGFCGRASDSYIILVICWYCLLPKWRKPDLLSALHATHEMIHVRIWFFLTEGVSYKGCHLLPRWYKAAVDCGSLGSSPPQRLSQRRRAEQHGGTRHCRLPSPVSCHHTWNWWGRGVAELSEPVSWQGGHYKNGDNYKCYVQAVWFFSILTNI